MLDDAFFNVENWIADELVAEFGQKEGAAFVSGNGTDKPKGFLNYTTSASDDAARTFGELQHVITGVDGDVVSDYVVANADGWRFTGTIIGAEDDLATAPKYANGVSAVPVDFSNHLRLRRS